MGETGHSPRPPDLATELTFGGKNEPEALVAVWCRPLNLRRHRTRSCKADNPRAQGTNQVIKNILRVLNYMVFFVILLMCPLHFQNSTWFLFSSKQLSQRCKITATMGLVSCTVLTLSPSLWGLNVKPKFVQISVGLGAVEVLKMSLKLSVFKWQVDFSHLAKLEVNPKILSLTLRPA